MSAVVDLPMTKCVYIFIRDTAFDKKRNGNVIYQDHCFTFSIGFSFVTSFLSQCLSKKKTLISWITQSLIGMNIYMDAHIYAGPFLSKDVFRNLLNMDFRVAFVMKKIFTPMLKILYLCRILFYNYSNIFVILCCFWYKK